MRLFLALLLLQVPTMASAELPSDWKGLCEVEEACTHDRCTRIPHLVVRLGKNWKNGQPTLNGEPALLFESRPEAESYLASHRWPDDLSAVRIPDYMPMALIADFSIIDGFDVSAHSISWPDKQQRSTLSDESIRIICVRGG